MQALRRAWALALAGVMVGGGVAAATVQSKVQPAVHGTVHAVAGTGFLLGYACPPGGKCIAVGGTGSLAGKNNGRGVVVPVVGGLPGAVTQLKGVFQINSIACPRSNFCLAVAEGTAKAEGAVIPITAGKPGNVRFVPGTGDLFGIACSSASSCWATGENRTQQSGIIVHIAGSADTVYGLAAFGPPPPFVFQGDNGAGAIWCQANDACLALGGNTYVTPNDPGGPGYVNVVSKGVVKAERDVYGMITLSAIACPSGASCWATGPANEVQPYAAAVVPIHNGRPGKVVFEQGSNDILAAIACRNSALCYAMGSAVVVISHGHVSEAAPIPFSADGAWCSRSRCTAVGSNGHQGIVYPFS